eukprot:TRINITY_DN8208_c0_g2_i1.p1 TRINITY_DN8208_c0_g2~~TRINITY_DN8208_c0_g2_i1.p1  ORF type:complete len:298 (-),score=5.26 TRINITY_DN8208_c0_g2_i1:247-1140(-)
MKQRSCKGWARTWSGVCVATLLCMCLTRDVAGLAVRAPGDVCATDGSSASVSVGTSTGTSGDLLVVRTNGCPNTAHANGVGDNPNTAREGSVSMYVPARPALAGRVFNTTLTLGAVGLALNGAVVFGPATGPQGGDAAVQECDTFDSAGGHSDPFGNYHHHVHSPLLADVQAARQLTACPIMAFMRDGFPLLAHASLCGIDPATLDACNGVLRPDGSYAYVLTGPIGPYPQDYPVDPATGYGAGFPYSIGCFRGCVPDQNGRYNAAGSYAECLRSATYLPSNQLSQQYLASLYPAAK